jgi:hypothetical protein
MSRVLSVSQALLQYEEAKRNLRLLGETAKSAMEQAAYRERLRGVHIASDGERIRVRAFDVELHLLPEAMSRSHGGWAVRALLMPFLDRRDPEVLGRLHIDSDGYVAMDGDDRSKVVALTADGAMEVICRFIERAVLSSMPHAILKFSA